MKSRFSLRFSALTFATVSTLSVTTARAATCNVPADYPTIQAAVGDPSCSTVTVASGVYVENVTINRSLNLFGSQEGNGSPLRPYDVGESTVTGMITVQAENVTINGFHLTNPGQPSGILIKALGNNILIKNNVVEAIGGLSCVGNTQAIYLENGPDNVSVVGNKIMGVEGIATSNGGVFIGDSTSTNPSLNILIEGNSISDIHSVSRGAYGIHVNNGSSTAPSAVGYTTVTIRNNTISNLAGGGWVHAIGLEGDTPGVLVVNNSISNLVAPMDAVAVWFEDNPSFSTGHVNQNNFDVTIAAYGIAVHPALTAVHYGLNWPYRNLSVDGACNWWGDPNGPGPIGPGLGARVSPGVDFTPWLTGPAPGAQCVGGCR